MRYDHFNDGVVVRHSYLTKINCTLFTHLWRGIVDEIESLVSLVRGVIFLQVFWSVLISLDVSVGVIVVSILCGKAVCLERCGEGNVCFMTGIRIYILVVLSNVSRFPCAVVNPVLRLRPPLLHPRFDI